uniref:BPL/LPL catalytic domain-containing protein n=1 Tax=Panagrolaimus sp. ES5 TaxID=591445 RepID=A0AC34G4W1_9BILA
MEGLTFGSNIGSSPTLFFEPIAKFPADVLPSSSNLPIKVCRQKNAFPEDIAFNTKLYYEVLNTKALGRALLFVPVCETTMNISKSLREAMPTVDGIIVVAQSQISGIGRSGNQWVSPIGCAMLTFNYNIPLSSNLGSNATFVQIILAVSICDAVKSLLNLPDFPIKIKWPNDIYYRREYKLGGIMITSSIYKSLLQCTIGAGINVANSEPTKCINDLIPDDCEKRVTVEEVIAETMNKFEYYVNIFENQGKQAFLRHYYNLWLHAGEEVEVQQISDGEKEMVLIKGLDEYGYLQVQSKSNGEVFSVHDDGNTFDMMKGLIRPKIRC